MCFQNHNAIQEKCNTNTEESDIIKNLCVKFNESLKCFTNFIPNLPLCFNIIETNINPLITRLMPEQKTRMMWPFLRNLNICQQKHGMFI